MYNKAVLPLILLGWAFFTGVEARPVNDFNQPTSLVMKVGSKTRLCREGQDPRTSGCRPMTAQMEVAVSSCTRITTAIANDDQMHGMLVAYDHLVNSKPTNDTCSHYKTLEDQLKKLSAVFKACQSLPDDEYGPEIYRAMDQKIRNVLARHRKTYPRLCS